MALDLLGNGAELMALQDTRSARSIKFLGT